MHGQTVLRRQAQLRLYAGCPRLDRGQVAKCAPFTQHILRNNFAARRGRDYCLPSSADCACLWNPCKEPTITTLACKDTTEFALSRKRPLPSTGYTQRSPAGERSDGQITSRRGVGGAAGPPTFNRVSRLCRLRGLLILLAKSIPYKFGRPLVDRICFLEKVAFATFSTR